MSNSLHNPDGLSESDITFRSTELLDNIPPRCLKCPTLRTLIAELNEIDGYKAAILRSPDPEIATRGLEEVAIQVGADVNELADTVKGALRAVMSRRVESRLSHADAHVEELVARAKETIGGCDGGPLTLRAQRGKHTLTVTTCMSKMLRAVAPPDATNGYPPVEMVAVKREFN